MGGVVVIAFFENSCKALPRGCVGCRCDANTCDPGLKCGGLDLCVFEALSNELALTQCLLGDRNCPCKDDGTCNAGLQCSNQKCVKPVSGTGNVVVTGPEGERDSIDDDGPPLGAIIGGVIGGLCCCFLVCGGVALIFCAAGSRGGSKTTGYVANNGTTVQNPVAANSPGYLGGGSDGAYPSQQMYPSQTAALENNMYPSQVAASESSACEK